MLMYLIPKNFQNKFSILIHYLFTERKMKREEQEESIDERSKYQRQICKCPIPFLCF